VDWYIQKGDKQLGPVDDAALRAMAAAGTIDRKTLLWHAGLTEWLPAENVPGLITPPPAPTSTGLLAAAPPDLKTATPFAANHSQPAAPESTIARPWPRYWARFIDVSIEIGALSFILGMLAPSLFQSGGIFDSNGPAKNLAGIVLLPVALVVDALLYSLLGNSLGKLILGIRVRHEDGRRLSLAAYLARNFRLYFYGLGIGIPLISLFTLISSHRRAARGELMSWDQANDSSPYSDSGMARSVLGAVCFLALIVGFILLEAYAQTSDTQRTRYASPSPNRADAPAAAPTAAVELQNAAAQINRDTPKMLDSVTRLDRATVGPGLTFTYAYTLTNTTGVNWDRERFSAAIKNNRSALVKTICANAMRTMLDAGITAQYRYSAMDGSTITTVQVRGSDCSG
jgi:uncharacterized RDD family membrane protein YckC